MKQLKQTVRKGFTLLETSLYVTLFVLIAGTITTLLWRVQDLHSQLRQEQQMRSSLVQIAQLWYDAESTADIVNFTNNEISFFDANTNQTDTFALNENMFLHNKQAAHAGKYNATWDILENNNTVVTKLVLTAPRFERSAKITLTTAK